MYSLSPSQRQLILLKISTFSYLLLCSAIYSQIENWKFDEALYWSVSTMATIGFGDYYPKRYEIFNLVCLVKSAYQFFHLLVLF